LIPVTKLEEMGLTFEHWMAACLQAEAKAVDTEELLLVQRRAAEHGRWDLVYNLSLIAGLETSVLIDANGAIQIDWGSPGRVPLRPPVGMMAPFRLWVHTHPGFHAYWSSTDRNSLAVAQGILDRALVLGAPGVKESRNIGEEGSTKRIGMIGPLSSWTDQEIVSWDHWLDSDSQIEIKVMA
jgi:hypothetical protein